MEGTKGGAVINVQIILLGTSDYTQSDALCATS
jgi:hypothetical protein